MATASPSTTRISLDGEWALRWCEAGEGETAGWPANGVAGPDAIPAQVPGLTHLALMAAGKIPEALLGENAREMEWMEEKDWWYSRRFQLTPDQMGDRVEIVFEGLDTLADIWINGNQVGSSHNALVAWRADITPHVRPGDNLVVVRVDTGLRWARTQDISRYGVQPSSLGKESRILLRRNAFSTRWDWAPNLPTCGIWQPARIETHRGLALRDVCLRSQLARDGSARLTALVEIDSFEPNIATDAVLHFELKEAAQAMLPVTLAPGYNLVTHTLRVPNPRLWWPHGSGEPYLYDFTCRLLHSDGMLADLAAFPFGIREIELRQEPLPGDEGYSFTLLVNGVQVFCKGGDWVPADSLLSRITPQRYEALIQEACEANFNMLRVWGGGTYEADAFWRACDRLGIMVWLDFQFGCQQAPEDRPDYLAEVEREAELAVKRLRNHASLVLWSGNNENQWLFSGPGRTFYGWRIYHEILAKATAQLDPPRPYWPSSPYGGLGFNDWDRGDRHAWQVSLMGEADGDLSRYEAMAQDRGKFITEYGFLAPPLRKSLEEALPPDQLRPNSPAWKFHANLFEGGASQGEKTVIAQALQGYFGRRPEDLDLDAFLFLTQMWQAEAYRSSLAHFRRRKFLTSGALFWMYNDCWLATTGWTIIDYYLRRKPSYYAVKRAFAPEMVSFSPKGDKLDIWLVSDRLKPISGVLEYGKGAFSQDRAEIIGCLPFEVRANCSQRLLSLELPPLPPDNMADIYYWARWTRKGQVISSHYHWLARCKDVTLPDPGLSWKVRTKRGQRVVEVSASRYAWAVVIEPAADLRPEDNYFDLLPGETRIVQVDGPDEAIGQIAAQASNHLLSRRG